MIGKYPATTHLLGQNAIWGCTILGCCCLFIDEFGGVTFPHSGRPARPRKERKRPDRSENPFIQFTPPALPQEPHEDVIQVPIAPESERDILPPEGTAESPLEPEGREAPAGLHLIGEAREDSQLYLQREEEAFLALILAAEADDDCCYDAHC